MQYEDEIWGECELCGFDGFLEQIICRDGITRDVCTECINEMEGNANYPENYMYD